MPSVIHKNYANGRPLKKSFRSYLILENVRLPLQIQGAHPAQARRKVVQRLTDPAMVVADEPTANLDSEMALNIIDLMRRLRAYPIRLF